MLCLLEAFCFSPAHSTNNYLSIFVLVGVLIFKVGTNKGLYYVQVLYQLKEAGISAMSNR